MKFRPCIDLHDGKVKQIVGATLADEETKLRENFVSGKDAAWYAELYRRHALPGGHVIMLGPGNRDAALQALRQFPGGLQIGGGITPENAPFYLDNGASHVIVTSYVFRDGRIDFDALQKMRTAVGRERLVLDLSYRKRGDVYWVVTDRWRNFTEYRVNPENLSALSRYCAEFLIHAADVEGLCQGVAVDLLPLLAGHADRPVTYAGGIAGIGDLEQLRDAGAGRLDATIGSALDIFGGGLSFEAVLDWFEKSQP